MWPNDKSNINGRKIFRKGRKTIRIVFREKLKYCAHFSVHLLNSPTNVRWFLMYCIFLS